MISPGHMGDNTPDIFMTYDTAANGASKLAVITEKDNTGLITGSTAYGYDNRGRLAGMMSTIEGQPFNISRTHTDGGRLATMTYPSGREMVFTRDILGRVPNLNTQVNELNVALVGSLGYSPFGTPTSLVTGNGGNIAVQKSSCGCGTETYNPDTERATSFTYDGNNNLTSVDTGNSYTSQAYTYTPAGRLETAQGPFNYSIWQNGDYRLIDSYSYSYDFQGNILTLDKPAVEGYARGCINNCAWLELTPKIDIDYTYNPSSDQMAEKINYVNSADSTTYGYDYAGNTTSYNGKTLTYDRRNRLLRVEEGANTLGEYTYNYLNQRITKTVDWSTRVFLHDFDGNIIGETYGSDGSMISEIIYSGSTRIARIDLHPDPPGELVYFYLNDRLGNPIALTDEDNNSVWEATYTPLGKADVYYNSLITNNFRFPGQYYDEGTGLHYNWNRYYDPSTGRYLTPDPIGLDGGLNLYLYVGGNPISEIDSDGLTPGLCCKTCNNAVGANVLLQLRRTNIDGSSAQSDLAGGNGFRHCLATCQATKACGEECAKDFWDGRENPSSGAGQQDLANNQVGYSVASSGGSCWDGCMMAWKNKKLDCKGKPCPAPLLYTPASSPEPYPYGP